MSFSTLNSLTVNLSTVSRCDRWQVYRRLQELSIPCECLADGQLHVEINSLMAGLQLRSVVWQLTATRPELLVWLKDCWQASDRP